MQTPFASYSASCASNSSAYPNPLMRLKHLKITLCKAYHLGVKEGLIPREQQHWAAAGSSSTWQTGGSISSMSFKRQATLLEGPLHSREETQALPSRRSPGERGGLLMNGTYVYMRICTCAACALKQVKRCVCASVQSGWCLCGLHVHKEGVVWSMQRRELCGPCRCAKLTPFEKNLSKLTAGLLPKEDGSLKPSLSMSNLCACGKRSLPALPGVAVRLLCSCCGVHSTACVHASATGQLWG